MNYKVPKSPCYANLNSATCEARTNQIVTYIEFKAIFMNIESVSYHSIVNRYMHDDSTMIFARVVTLQLGFSDSSSLANVPSTHIHNPNPFKWGFDYPLAYKCQTFLFKMSRTLARSKYSNRAVTYSNTVFRKH